MTSEDDERLDGRHPEFARMSLRPGLGAHMMDEVASAILENDLHLTMEDVPAGLRHGSQIWPLDRYLRERLRERIGRDKKTPQSVKDRKAAELQALSRLVGIDAPRGFKTAFLRNFLVMARQGEADRLEYRNRGLKHETL